MHTTKFINQMVLLGASNLTRGLATAIEAAQLICGGPSRILVAAGHGRSFAVYSRVLFRGLPGITRCGLWDELARGPRLPTFALLTDLGNDIAYGVSAEQIIGYVRWCVERLAEHQARIIITTLPLQRLERLSPTRYRIFRAVFFPGRRLGLEQALDRARTVNVALQQLSFERRITLVDQRPKWYGLDPIHIRRRRLAGAYYGILRHWVDADREEPAARKTSTRRWLQSLLLAPQYECVFGFDRYREQPTGRLPDGTTIALY
ncbi:MAG: hypothetical protein L0Z68_03680 [Gammaproteobacteria bacterium]|nr:hypothetical protein [Gammaproteobacteria bacterium]